MAGSCSSATGTSCPRWAPARCSPTSSPRVSCRWSGSTRSSGRRGASAIVVGAHEVNAGRVPAFSADEAGDFFFVERTEPERAVDTILDLVANRIPREVRARSPPRRAGARADAARHPRRGQPQPPAAGAAHPGRPFGRARQRRVPCRRPGDAGAQRLRPGRVQRRPGRRWRAWTRRPARSPCGSTPARPTTTRPTSTTWRSRGRAPSTSRREASSRGWSWRCTPSTTCCCSARCSTRRSPGRAGWRSSWAAGRRSAWPCGTRQQRTAGARCSPSG